jgi:hypothetical protein
MRGGFLSKTPLPIAQHTWRINILYSDASVANFGHNRRMLVAVLEDCVMETKETPCRPKTSIGLAGTAALA